MRCPYLWHVKHSIMCNMGCLASSHTDHMVSLGTRLGNSQFQYIVVGSWVDISPGAVQLMEKGCLIQSVRAGKEMASCSRFTMGLGKLELRPSCPLP